MNRIALSLAPCALCLAGCIAGPGVSPGQGMVAPAAADPGEAQLAFCVPPQQDPDGSTRTLDVDYARLGLRFIPSAAAAAGCDLLLQFTQHSGQTDFRYEVSSAYSGTPQASGQITNWVGVNSMVGKLMGDLRRQFAPGTAGYHAIVTEKRKTTRVGQRTRILAPPERQQQIDAAAQEGDAALASGKGRAAFAAYARALSGPWSDDETSHRVRGTFLKLVGEHPEYAPPVPEEARMHMVRARAILKDSTEFEAYDEALGEMGAAASAAPWWSDIYYNAALVAEKAGYLEDAIGALKGYLLANPRASDARAVQDKIYALEVRQERAGRQ